MLTPMPVFSVLLIAPAALTMVESEVARTEAQPARTTTPSATCASVSARCSARLSEPLIATLPALPPDVAKVPTNALSAALTSRPPSAPAKIRAPAPTVACVFVLREIALSDPP